MGCHFLLQRIFQTQGSNLGLPHCRQMLYHLNHQGSPTGILCYHKICFITLDNYRLKYEYSASSVYLLFKRNAGIHSLSFINFLYVEKGMATHSCILAWEIPWTEEPGGLQSMDLQSRTRLSDFACL